MRNSAKRDNSLTPSECFAGAGPGEDETEHSSSGQQIPEAYLLDLLFKIRRQWLQKLTLRKFMDEIKYLQELCDGP